MLSAPHTLVTFNPKEILQVLISVIGWVDSRTRVWLDGVCQWKFPMIPSEIKRTVFRLVVWYLNQLHHGVPPQTHITLYILQDDTRSLQCQHILCLHLSALITVRTFVTHTSSPWDMYCTADNIEQDMSNWKNTHKLNCYCLLPKTIKL